jgi:lysophospholipase L1-like esterase
LLGLPVEYPYGTIKINRHGFPDDDFDMEKDRNVGYFGDSVTYGVGAGCGYRFSELLEDPYLEYEHMKFGGIGLSISETDIRRIARQVEEFELDTAIYFFNLNDIVPDRVLTGGRTQQLLVESLDAEAEWVDLREAFLDPENLEQSRSNISIGEFFVYNKGDKLDWNHPNRAGHRRIAEHLARIDVLGRPRS